MSVAKSVQLAGWELSDFAHGGHSRPVYRRGSGPGVVVMHEVPGVTPKVEAFARRVADAGFTVAMPSLLGTPGKRPTVGYSVAQIGRACIRKEFTVMATRRSSAITDLLRALCRQLHAEVGGPGVGAIGMCLTGNFALSLMVDPVVMAPVLSQPSLPFGITPKQKAAVHLSAEELSIVKRRARDEGVPVLGLRFTHDIMCPKARFDTLRRELGPRFEAIEIDSGPGNPWGHPRIAHSVVTEHLIDEAGQPTRAAVERVLEFFAENLKPDGGASAPV